ncbi:hypothetical protein ACLILW_16990 [Shewanella baltica]|uniref:hypothetical protein n=1 Tax=Shewanella baltica TaxID=62322 RepID=UPI0039848167
MEVNNYNKIKIIAVTILLLVVLFIPFILYWYLFQDYSISRNNQDWANLGSYLGGVYTFFASLASLATLIFLLYQYYSQKDYQQRLAVAQLEIINFQKYQAHYQQFLLVIDNLEQDVNYNVSIINRGDLYKKLFPKNSFEQVSYKVDLNEMDVDYVLNYVKLCAQNLKGLFSSTDESDRPAREIIPILSMLYDSLFIKLDRPEKEGDIVFQLGNSERYIILNTENLREVTENLWAVINMLFQFTGNTAPDDITYQVGTSFTLRSMSIYKDSIKKERHGYILVQSE